MQTKTEQIDGQKLFWLTILFLIPTFLQRIANSGQGDSVGEFDGISLASVGYICNLLIILIGLFVVKSEIYFSHLLILLAVFIFGLIQVSISYSLYSTSFTGIAFAYLRGVIWVFCAYIFAAKIFDKDIFVDAFMKITFGFFCVVILSVAIYYTTGIPFGMVIGQGTERAHGLFSEPSVLGAIAPAFVLIAVSKRNYIQVLIGILALYFANSTTAYTTFVLVVAVQLFHRFPKLQITMVFSIVSVFAFIVVQLDLATSYYIADVARSISETLDAWIGRSEFRAFTIDRLLNSIIDIPRFLRSGETEYNQDLGSLARLGGPRVMVNHMYNDGLYWFGYGLSVFAVVSLQIYRSVLDFGILPYFISCFGVGMGVLVILFFTWAISSWRKIDFRLFVIFVSALFGTLLNSAGGLSLYILVLLGAFSAVVFKTRRHAPGDA